MNKKLTIILSFLAGSIFFAGVSLAAPPYILQGTINPITDNTYDLGSSTLRWKRIYGVSFYGDGSNLTGVATTQTTTTINGVSGPAFTFASSTTGTDFSITSSLGTLTFNFPDSSASARGLLTLTDWTTFNNKEPAIATGVAGQWWRYDKSWQFLTQADISGLTSTSSPTFGGLTLTGKSGMAKFTAGVLGTATSGTDYAPATTGSSILKGNGSGGFSNAANGTDFTLITPISCSAGQHLASTTATGVFVCSADTGTGGGGATSTINITAGENLLKNDAVKLLSTTSSSQVVDLGQVWDTAYNFGNPTTVKSEQTFQLSQSATIAGVKAVLRKTGTSTDYLTASIKQTQNGTPLAMAYALGSGIDPGGAYLEMLFDQGVVIPANTTYRIEWSRTGAADAINYYGIWGLAAGTYASGTASTYNGSTWTDTGADFQLILESVNATSSAIKASAATSTTSNAIGLVMSDTTSGNPANVMTTGINGNFTGLIPGDTYYLGNATGTITNKAGTVSKEIGVAASSTQLMIIIK